MRDFRDAKAMAHTLRKALAMRDCQLSNSESLELTAKMFGLADWNTLSALIQGRAAASAVPGPDPLGGPGLPALPVRDQVPFPTSPTPYWIKRAGTLAALQQAFANRRELVVVAQKNPDVDDPASEDIFDIGVAGRIVDMGPPSEHLLMEHPSLAGSTQVVVQMHRRVAIKRFTGADGHYRVAVEEIDEGPIAPDPVLAGRAAAALDGLQARRPNTVLSRLAPSLRELHDVGRIADLIAPHLALSVAEKQAVLATLDPVERLTAVVRHIEGS